MDAHNISKHRPQRGTSTAQRVSASPVVRVVRRSVPEVIKQRLAIKDGATKHQLLDPAEIPGALDPRDELSAHSSEAVSQALKQVANTIGHGKYHLKHDLWQGLDLFYPYENDRDRDWVQSEISKRRAQLQQPPPTDTSPPIAGSPSKRVAEAEHHIETKKQKTEDSTTSRASGGQGSNIEHVHMSQPERISKVNGSDRDKSVHDETEEEQAMKPLLALLSRKKDETKTLVETLQGKEKVIQKMKTKLDSQNEENSRLKSQLISSCQENEKLKADLQGARNSLALFE